MKKRTVISLLVVFCLAFALTACGGNKDKVISINSPSDFPGHDIAVQVDTTAQFAIDEMIEAGAKNIKVHRYEKVTQCFDDLALGRVDAVYVDSVVAGFYTSGSSKYRLAWLNDEGEPLGICLAKSSAKLAAAVEAAIDTMFFDGSMARIAKEHFGDRIDLVEYKFTLKENIARCKKMGVPNLPSMYINGELKYSSIIPSRQELYNEIDKAMK